MAAGEWLYLLAANCFCPADFLFMSQSNNNNNNNSTDGGVCQALAELSDQSTNKNKCSVLANVASMLRTFPAAVSWALAAVWCVYGSLLFVPVLYFWLHNVHGSQHVPGQRG